MLVPAHAALRAWAESERAAGRKENACLLDDAVEQHEKAVETVRRLKGELEEAKRLLAAQPRCFELPLSGVALRCSPLLPVDELWAHPDTFSPQRIEARIAEAKEAARKIADLLAQPIVIVAGPKEPA